MEKQRKPQSIENLLLNGKIPPQAISVEEAVIGAVILNSDAFETVAPVLSSEMFYNNNNRYIYEAAQSLYQQNKPIDLVTIVETLRDKNTLELSGGAYYISQLTNQVTSSAHIEYHASIVKEKYIGRKVIEFSALAMNDVYSGESIPDVMERLEKELAELFAVFAGGSMAQHISVSAEKALQAAYTRIELAKYGRFCGIDTGLTELNKITTGWQAGELIVLAARPGMGKTAFLLHFAKSAVLTGEKHACIFSLEMTDVSLADRMLLSETEINPNKYLSGYLNRDEISEIEHAKEVVSRMNIYVDDKPSVSMSYIRNKSKILKKEGKCDIILIDYLQLATDSTTDKNQNREQVISMMSRQAKSMAKELNVPVILLSQLSRSVESRGGDKRPMLSDLRESGAIEQDADMVMFIYRPHYYGMKGEGDDSLDGFGELIISKHRKGATGTIFFEHNTGLTRITDHNEGF